MCQPALTYVCKSAVTSQSKLNGDGGHKLCTFDSGVCLSTSAAAPAICRSCRLLSCLNRGSVSTIRGLVVGSDELLQVTVLVQTGLTVGPFDWNARNCLDLGDRTASLGNLMGTVISKG